MELFYWKSKKYNFCSKLGDEILYFIKLYFVAGGRQADDIITWLKKKTGPPAVEVSSAEQAKELIAANNVIIFGFFSDSNTAKAKTFTSVASAVDDHVFALVSDPKVITELEAEDEDVVLYKNVSTCFN